MSDPATVSTTIMPGMQKLLDQFGNHDDEEPILHDSRQTITPAKYPKALELMAEQQRLFWTQDEIDASADYAEFMKLPKPAQEYIKRVLAFFLVGDVLVNENLAKNFTQEIEAPELKATYSVQAAMETAHHLTYEKLFDVYVPDKSEQVRLKESIETSPSIIWKKHWAEKWISNKKLPLVVRVIAFVCVEVIFFQSQFASIQWAVNLVPGMTGLAMSNTFISRDETKHGGFGMYVTGLFDHKPTNELIECIVREAVDLECACIREALEKPLVGLNQTMLCQFTEYIGDSVFTDLTGVKKPLYGSENPFDFYTMISSAPSKANFFERKSTDYKVGTVTPLPRIMPNVSVEEFRKQYKKKQLSVMQQMTA